MIYLLMVFLSFLTVSSRDVYADMKTCESFVDLARRTCKTTEKVEDKNSLMHFESSGCEPTAMTMKVMYQNISTEKSKGLGPHQACIDILEKEKQQIVKTSSGNDLVKANVKTTKTVRFFGKDRTTEIVEESKNSKRLTIMSTDQYRLVCNYAKDLKTKCTKEQIRPMESKTARSYEEQVGEPTPEQLDLIRKGGSLNDLIKPSYNSSTQQAVTPTGTR